MKREYKALRQQTFTIGKYSIVPIRYEDRFDIMDWRNVQLYHLRQNTTLTPVLQDKYFKNVINKLFKLDEPGQILFSYLEDNICIGYGGLVHINWTDKNAEISFLMNTQRENNEFGKHWKIFLYLIEKAAFEVLSLHKVFTYAFDLRPHLYSILESSGFINEAVLKDHCYYLDSYKDVVIHSKIDDGIKIRKISTEDADLIFKWSNEKTTRDNSFNSNLIEYKDHKSWFSRKLNDNNSAYFIGEIDNTPVAFIRFDIDIEKITVGISIDKEYRGRKLSIAFLSKGSDIISTLYNLPIIAYIKKSNLPSVNAFKKAGFFYSKDILINGIESYEYKYDNNK